MICYARSGGTLLNRCLGVLPHVVILSEVHRLGGGSGAPDAPALTTVREQAAGWYGIELQSEGHVDNLLELEAICESRGLHLVVREWSFLDFTPSPENGFCPSNHLETLQALRDRCTVYPFAFVRDAIDVWLSRAVPLEAFATSYLRYAQALVQADLSIFRYEDFCRDPDGQMRQICAYGGLPFSEAYRQYDRFTKVNGDVQGLSRGLKQGGFAVLPRRRIGTRQRRRLDACLAIRQANEYLGYPVNYTARPCEGYVPYMQRMAGGMVRSAFGVVRSLKTEFRKQ